MEPDSKQVGQWVAARHSIPLFDDSGHTSWTVRHGFYANMGALHLQTPDFKPFPIDAKQLHYLVVNGYVEYPSIPYGHIRDKNKVDGMLRLIALGQSLWFIVNLIGRVVQHLDITALELSTSAWVLMGAATSLCWMSKPADIQQPDYISTTGASMAQILRDADDKAAYPYYYTPLDFVSRDEWPWSRLWSHALNLLRMTHVAAPSSVRPIPHIQNTIAPRLDFRHHVILVVVSVAYFAVFLLGWNFNFPTRIEVILWRVSSFVGPACACAIMVGMYIPTVYDWVALKIEHGQNGKKGCQTGVSSSTDVNTVENAVSGSGSGSTRDRVSNSPPTSGKHIGGNNSDLPATATNRRRRARSGKPSLFSKMIDAFRNNSVLRDPQLDTPPLFILSVWIFGFIYCLSRTYIIAADITELRSLPRSAFQTVEWWSFLPHLI